MHVGVALVFRESVEAPCHVVGPHAYIYGVSGEEAEPLLIMDGLMEGSREREKGGSFCLVHLQLKLADGMFTSKLGLQYKSNNKDHVIGEFQLLL